MLDRTIKIIKNIKTKHILLIILGVLFLGVGASIAVFIATYFSSDLNTLKFCLDNSCVKYFFQEIDQSLFFLEVTFNLLIVIITAGGISIALAHYLVESKSTSLSNHLSNFSVFNEYLKHEIEKIKTVSENTVNIFGLYNLIFKDSRKGNMEISQEYCELVHKLNDTIETSNEKVTNPKKGGFSVLKHQDAMLPILRQFFFNLERIERTEYFEIESSILHLIQLINRSFCNSELLVEITKRKYI